MGLDVTGQYRYPPPDLTWLEQVEEDVLDPELVIVDSHHHLWEQGGVPYLLNEILSDTQSGHRIVATVFVQANYGYRTSGSAHLAPVGETEKVAALRKAARQLGSPTDIAAAVVAHADLMLGEAVQEVLVAHAEAAEGALRGIRHSVSRDENFPNGIVLRPAPAGMLADTQYRTGLKRLRDHDLVYEAMLYHQQIPELASMAKALPDLKIVLDHMGCILGIGSYQGRERETFLSWRKNMEGLSQCPNVHVKIGGFGMIICGARWHERSMPPSSAELAEAWRPFVETCIDLFGVERCMFESNFPVDKAMYSYRTLWNSFKRLTASMGDTERAALFAGTAVRIYDIPLEGRAVAQVYASG